MSARRALARAALLGVVGAALLRAAQAAPQEAEAQALTRHVGRVTLVLAPRHARVGGLLVVRLTSSARLGSANAILDGRRVPFYPTPRGSRALLPIGVAASPGAATLGVEILGRRSRQRIPVELTLAPRAYPSRSLTVPPGQQDAPRRAEAVRDGRLLLEALRGLTSSALASDRFLAPVAGAPGRGFGTASSFVGLDPALGVEQVFDSVAGAYHHGADYDTPAETPVRAPADGRVVLAARLTLSGFTLVIDHGEAVASVLAHLGSLSAVPGQTVRAGEVVARSGQSGFSAWPHVHWGTYVHAVPVDPEVFLEGLGD